METFIKHRQNIITKFQIFAIAFFSLILVSVQDLSFYKYGELFRTPFSFLLLIISLGFTFWFLKNGSFFLSKIEKLFIIYLFYLIAITWINIFIYIPTNSIYLLGKNIILKGLIFLIYYVFFVISIIYFRLIFQKLSYIVNFYLFSIINILIFFIFLIELKNIPNFSLLHNQIPYYRIRLLTHEASWAGSLVLTFYFLNLYFYFKSNKKYFKINTFIIIMITLFLFIFIVYSGSKGLYVTLIVSFLILSFLILGKVLKYIFLKVKIRKKYFYLLLSSLLAITLFYIVFWDLLSPMFLMDIENFYSVTTRSIMILSAIKMFLSNPLGYGTSIFFPKLLEIIYDYIVNNSLGFIFKNTQELETYFYTYKGLAVKSFFFQNLALGGIIFLFIFFLIIKEGFRLLNKTNYILLWLYISIILSLIFYMNLDIKYQYAAFFALISSEVLKNERKNLNLSSRFSISSKPWRKI